MKTLARELPLDNRVARESIYAGQAYRLPARPAARRLAAEVLDLLQHELGPGDVRTAEDRMSPEAYFEVMGRVRRSLFNEPRFHAAVRAVLAENGFDPERIAFDPLRLRAIAHAGDRNPRAAAVYYPHRDIWYGHPPSMIVWWIALHPCNERETFVFYPEYFARAVPNDSEIFDYERWKDDRRGLKIGWQHRDAGLEVRYPGVTAEIDPGPAIGFACEPGESLVFSGAQFHKTLAQTEGRTRFSVDFRCVHLDDESARRGAPSVDDRSRGSALPDYVQPGAL